MLCDSSKSVSSPDVESVSSEVGGLISIEEFMTSISCCCNICCRCFKTISFLLRAFLRDSRVFNLCWSILVLVRSSTTSDFLPGNLLEVSDTNSSQDESDDEVPLVSTFERSEVISMLDKLLDVIKSKMLCSWESLNE